MDNLSAYEKFQAIIATAAQSINTTYEKYEAGEIMFREYLRTKESILRRAGIPSRAYHQWCQVQSWAAQGK